MTLDGRKEFPGVETVGFVSYIDQIILLIFTDYSRDRLFKK